MTKKKIRYSELAPAAPALSTPAVEPTPLAAPVAAPAVVVAPLRARAPVDLARALAAAREREAHPVAAPVAESVVIAAEAALPVAAQADLAPFDAVQSLRDRARARSGSVDLLVFAIGHEWFGVDLAAVEEAIDLPAVRHIPEMPPAMLGVTTARGQLTSVYSPAYALGVPLVAGSSALIFRRQRGRLAIAVDDVDDVHTLDLALLREAPGMDAADGIMLGVLRYRDTLLALVDAEALVAACQIVPVLETA